MAVPAATAPLFFPSRRGCVGIDIDNGDDSDANGFVMVSVDGFGLFYALLFRFVSFRFVSSSFRFVRSID